MDYFDLLSSMDQAASSKDSDSPEGDGNTEGGNGSSMQEVTPFSVDISGSLGFAGGDTQDGYPHFEPSPLQVSANPCVNQLEVGDFAHTGDPCGEQSDFNVTDEDPVLTFHLGNTSAFHQGESCDPGPTEMCTSELTDSQFLEDTENQLEPSIQSGSTSSLESDGSTPWVQAVLLTKKTKETKTCDEQSADKTLSNSEGMLTESSSASEALTPSFSEETDEELLKEKPVARLPDEVIMDPSDVAFLQNDVWHQNWAFVPIPNAEIPEVQREDQGDEENLELLAVPMDCDPSNSERENHGIGEDGPSKHDAVSILPSYIASVHKELVVWNNEPTETEDNSCFSFGNQPVSGEPNVLSSEEFPSSISSPSSELAAASAQSAPNVTTPEENVASGSQDPLVREILRDRADGSSVKTQESNQTWNTERIAPLYCSAQETNPASIVANREAWSRDMALHLVEEQGSMECMITANKIQVDYTSDNDVKIIEQESSESSEEQEEEEEEEITEMLDENDIVQIEAQPGIAEEMMDLKALLANGNKPGREVAKSLASKLYNLDGFKRTDVAPYLEKNNEFSQMVAEEYLQLFDFSEMALDEALRKFLMAFVLTGETQERERVLNHFSNRFQECNPDILHSRDAVHTMTCALMLLNTDLHGQNLGKSMSSQDFITNLEGMNDGKDFPKDMLKALYHSIKSKKMEWAIDEEELQKSIMPKGEDAVNVTRVTDKGSPFLEVPNDHKAATYKQGFLIRKVHADIDGKKTPWGKRSWKTFYAVLKGTVIYLSKDEYKLTKQSAEEAISIHHSLATKAAEYNKRPHVFRLKTADWRIFLFQAQSADQMNSWITRINLVAAIFSSPPFPAAVGSKRKFSRPILPSATSKQSQEEQLESHDSMLQTILDDLDDLQMNFPEKKGKAKEFEEYKVKQEYFEYEKCRIETYVNLLKVKLNEATDDLDKLEAHLYGIAEGKESTLKKSHSSPSLNLEQVPVVKVKRNVSERRTYRKIIPSRHKKLI
ncbi:PH and SEC7 domain-containing protein 4-like [Carcharodon carcharias]|uniref:PH and SEC7 domain-containing protein 4-like n=1 Tax=Carcharodon carcharias TaxID=13397 RepID=UPI001B7E95B4|nr:PH and SEC7 domain-containing protein 4-like [Carcharodon carcharias]